jgi:hypothetical protein
VLFSLRLEIPLLTTSLRISPTIHWLVEKSSRQLGSGCHDTMRSQDVFAGSGREAVTRDSNSNQTNTIFVVERRNRERKEERFSRSKGASLSEFSAFGGSSHLWTIIVQPTICSPSL